MCMIGEFVKMQTVPRATPLTGWRTWRIGPAGSLRSVFKGHTWRRVSHADKRPTSTPQHGLWAFKSQTAAKANGSPYGRVELWGRVAVHTGGYRAEHARIIRVVFGQLQSRCSAPCSVCNKEKANLETARRRWRTVPARGKK